MSLEFLWYIPNQVGPATGATTWPRLGHAWSCLTEHAQAAGAARLGRRAARDRLGPAGHVHRGHRARRADHHVPAAGGDQARLLAPRTLRVGREHARRAQRWPAADQHRVRAGQPRGVRRQRGRPGAAVRADQGVPPARTTAVDRGAGRHLQRRALPGRPTRPSPRGPSDGEGAGTRGSTSAAPPRRPNASRPPTPTSSSSGASRSTASPNASTASTASATNSAASTSRWSSACGSPR